LVLGEPYHQMQAIAGAGGRPELFAVTGDHQLAHGWCQPTTCAQRGLDCGTISDGCGGVVDCGSCSAGQLCGVDTPNVCATQCTPKRLSCIRKCSPVVDSCGKETCCGGARCCFI
jgi:hypothetical protein